MAIRVYVVEDHPVMRETLRDYLTLNPDIELCGMAATAEEALEELGAADAAVILIDLALPDRSGIDLIREIAARWRTPCLILSGHAERSYVQRALAAGAWGYVLKGDPSEVPAGIRRVHEGKRFVSRSLRATFDHEPEGTGA